MALCMTSMKRSENSVATSSAVRPCSLARLMILSSTSVRFWAKVTSYPLAISHRRITSKEMNVRALPIWMLS